MGNFIPSVSPRWKELTPRQSPLIRREIAQIGTSLWYSTSQRHANSGEGGMVEYCMKTDKIINAVPYPADIAPFSHGCCKYKDNIYLIDGHNGMIIFFEPKTHKFSIKLTFRKIGRSPSCVLLHDDIHIFHGQNNTKHYIYSLTSNTIQELHDPAAVHKKKLVSSLTFRNRIIRFGGWIEDGEDISSLGMASSFWISSVINSSTHDKIQWYSPKAYRLPYPMSTPGIIVYKQYVIIFGGSLGNGVFSDKVHVLDLNLSGRWNELTHIKCPMPSAYRAVLTDDGIVHLFTEVNKWPKWHQSVSKHYCFCITALLGGIAMDKADDDYGNVEMKCSECVIMQNQVDEQQAKIAFLNAELLRIQTELKSVKFKAKQKIDTRQYLQWTSDDVVDWILSLENGAFKQYEDEIRVSFNKEGVTGSTMRMLDKSELRGLGIVNIVHRNVLMQHIHELVNRNRTNSNNNNDSNHNEYIPAPHKPIAFGQDRHNNNNNQNEGDKSTDYI